MAAQRQSFTYLVTGFPQFLARHLAQRLAAEERTASLLLLASRPLAPFARREVPAVEVEIIEGEVEDMHLGLSGGEYGRLCERVTHIIHVGNCSVLGRPGGRPALGRPWMGPRAMTDHGFVNLLELARDCRELCRLVLFSSVFVSGDREGVIAEDELDLGQKLPSANEVANLKAEKLLRSAIAKGLPGLVLRLPMIVGDSHTGEIDRFDGPLYRGILRLLKPVGLPFTLPGSGGAPLHVAPIDFLVAASLELARREEAVGRTFHVVDPSPMSTRRAFESIARALGRPPPRMIVPARAAEVLLHMPILDNLARPSWAVSGYLERLAYYNSQATLDQLRDSGIHCPPLASYLPRLIEYVSSHRERIEEDSELEQDPLDRPPGDPAEG